MTPIIDQLADTGLKLTNYYVHEMCTPTRFVSFRTVVSRLTLSHND
jgi:arylsulfatase A-like enzyme